MIHLLMLAFGIVGLYFGAEWLVLGASRIAARLRVSTLVIGLTVVAFGTSMPEVLAGVVAAWRGATDIVLGNVLGSNVANVGLILGLCAVIAPIPLHLRILYREVPLMVAATVLAWAMAADGTIGRVEGALLFFLLVVSTILMLRWARADGADVVSELHDLEDELGLHAEVNLQSEVARVAAGLVALGGGAYLLVEAAIAGARVLGVSEFLISLTVVAVGTSLPELATSMIAVARGESDMLVGNIVGSNLFNVLGALAVATLVHPAPVASAILGIDFPVVLIFSLAMAVVLHTHRSVVRWEGAMLLAAYVAYVGYSVVAQA